MNESNLLDRGRFYGTAVVNRSVGEVTLAEGRYAGRARIPAHAHSADYFCLVLDGWFEETWGSEQETCGPGTLVFHLAHEVHADRFGDAGARCFNLEIAPRLAERLAEEGTLPRSRVTLAPGRAGVLAAALRREREPSAMEIEETVLALLAELAPSRPPRGRAPAWVGRAIERLREPGAPTIASLAEEAGVHPVYFTRAFRAAVHATPSEVARRARLERAAVELLRRGASVASVAHGTGFADHSHFCRKFRRSFGVTPTEYRKLFRERLPLSP